MKTETMMWLLPVVFMIHDFEEIVMMRPWVEKNRGFLAARFPRLAARMLPHFESLSTSAFALAVAEEFVILSAVTLVAVEYGIYPLWAGVLIGFLVHLVVHVGQFIVVRRYVPVIFTSVLAGAWCVWALIVLSQRVPLPWGETLFWTVTALVVIAVNLVLVHKAAARFDRWVAEKYRAK